METLLVQRVQHPVGQGGFHSQTLQHRDRKFRMVYDCGALGSECRSALLREIDCYSAQFDDSEQLGLLVISHLDSDHCNGVEELLARCGADTVMLPYLNDDERVLEMANTADKGGLTGSMLDLLANPVPWFRDRGVRRVIQVDPAGEDEGDVQPRLDLGPPPERLTKMDNARFALQPSGRWLPPDADYDRMKCGELLTLSYEGSYVWWIFAPFAFQPAAGLLPGFKDCVSQMLHNAASPLPPVIDSAALKQLLMQVDVRRELARLYKMFGRDRNVTSLALYSGPAFPGDKLRVSGDTLGRGFCYGQNRVAWLGTGDWQLKTRRKRDLFEKYYARFADQVGVFAMPHHGSRHNAPPPDFWNWLTPDEVVVAAGSEGEHPHSEVIDALRVKLGDEVRIVTEKADSQWSDSMRLDLNP